MKKILPILLCYVLSASQVFALSGGPVFNTGSVKPTGSYSGVIEGVTETDDTTGGSGPAIPGDPLGGPPAASTTPSNALGLFNLTVPSTGSATGGFVLFQDGIVFTGTITASVDPDSDKLLGILEGTFNFNLQTFDNTGQPVSTAITAQAIGKINAKITPAPFSSNALARINGTANLDINFGQVSSTTLAPIISRSDTFNVIGFKQSNSVSGTTAATTG